MILIDLGSASFGKETITDVEGLFGRSDLVRISRVIIFLKAIANGSTASQSHSHPKERRLECCKLLY